MTAHNWKKPFLDSLYGRISFEDKLLDLIQAPLVQRLRHVRLSNIDSIDMPGISNISRFEHVLGVAFLANIVGLRPVMNEFDKLALSASALLHDWAITSSGHLVEEALQYVGTTFEHESKLVDIVNNESSDEIGGINFQIFLGRQTGLKSWAKKAVGRRSDDLIESITQHIQGGGQFGKIICGDMDLDNIDNVFRMAFHMGLFFDKEIPVRLAKSIVGVDNGEPVFRSNAKSDIESWSMTRRNVYQNLMLSERDFIGKMMMLYASIVAYENEEITKSNWNFVDYNFINVLLNSKIKEVKNTVQRWLTGELWDCTSLNWMSGSRPSYPKLLEFSRCISDVLRRQCFVYGIKDKRDRLLSIHFDDKSDQSIGSDSRQWLMGVGSSKKSSFTVIEVNTITEMAKDFLDATVIQSASINNYEGDDQSCLF